MKEALPGMPARLRMARKICCRTAEQRKPQKAGRGSGRHTSATQALTAGATIDCG
jgi:hypothetical protein